MRQTWNKQTRPIRVMARHLRPSCDPDYIKHELQSNFKILKVENTVIPRFTDRMRSMETVRISKIRKTKPILVWDSTGNK